MNNINKIMLIIALMILGTTFISCNEEQDIELNNIVSNKIIVKSPRNDMNPYDSIGELHNIWLHKLMILKRQKELELDKRLDEQTEFLLNIYSNYIKEHDFDTNGIYKNVMLIKKNEKDCFFKLIDNQDLSEISKQTIKKIIMQNISRWKYDNETDYSIYYDNIVKIESDIVNKNIAIPPHELQRILSFTSVFRHSMYYWMDRNERNKNNGHNKPLYSFWKTFLWDAIGCITGSLVGQSVAGFAICSAMAASDDIKNGKAKIDVDGGNISITYDRETRDQEQDGNAESDIEEGNN